MVLRKQIILNRMVVYMELDIECLRNDLLNYFGSATFFNQFAYVNVIEVENASDYQLIEIALKNHLI